MANIIVREAYLAKIEKYLGKEFIIVLTGQRRVGKSCLLKMLSDSKSADPGNNIIFIDKEKKDFDFIRTYCDLNDYIDSRYQPGRHNYILIDEVQDIEGFERSVRSYRTEPDAEVVVTGSNAKMLSTELTTLIGGRYKEVHVQPLSYKEFLKFHALADSDESLARYIRCGGMPGLAKIGFEDVDAMEYLRDVLNTVLIKDVIMRNSIRNVAFLNNLVAFLADNVGQLVSANSIAKYMKSQGGAITSTTVIDYARGLADAYVVNRVDRYDIHGKRLYDNISKYYFADHGLRNAVVGGTREGDIEKAIENIVYQRLVGLGYSVTVGQLPNGEVDFVAQKGSQRVYVQASYVIASQSTREREFGNLHAIRDNYPKYVVSMTPLIVEADDNGVIHLGLRRFLLDDDL